MPPKKTNRVIGPKFTRTDLQINQYNLEEKLEELFTPTVNELTREMSYDELLLLCRRVPCIVDMTKWNSVHDNVCRLIRENRLQKRTSERRVRILERAANMNLERATYKEENIRREWQEEWEFRKLQNICLLEMWQQDDEQENNANDDEVAAEIDDDDDLESNDFELEANNTIAMPPQQKRIDSQLRMSDEEFTSELEIVPESDERIITELCYDDMIMCPDVSDSETLSQQHSADPEAGKPIEMLNAVNSVSLTLNSDMSDITDITLSAPLSQNAVGDYLANSEDFNALPLTATSTQELNS